jgi:hypothetical protein
MQTMCPGKKTALSGQKTCFAESMSKKGARMYSLSTIHPAAYPATFPVGLIGYDYLFSVNTAIAISVLELTKPFCPTHPPPEPAPQR